MTCVRPAARRDLPRLYEVFFAAVRGADLYTVPERHAWAPKRKPGPGWVKRLERQQVWVARDLSGPIGFISLRRDGYIDYAFILPRCQGRGLLRALMAPVLAQNLDLSTHASLHAQPAFAALGFETHHHERVHLRGQCLRRAYMRHSPNAKSGPELTQR